MLDWKFVINIKYNLIVDLNILIPCEKNVFLKAIKPLNEFDK